MESQRDAGGLEGRSSLLLLHCRVQLCNRSKVELQQRQAAARLGTTILDHLVCCRLTCTLGRPRVYIGLLQQ